MKVEGCFDFYPEENTGYYENLTAREEGIVVLGFGLREKEQPKIRIFMTQEQAEEVVRTLTEALFVVRNPTFVFGEDNVG